MTSPTSASAGSRHVLERALSGNAIAFSSAQAFTPGVLRGDCQARSRAFPRSFSSRLPKPGEPDYLLGRHARPRRERLGYGNAQCAVRPWEVEFSPGAYYISNHRCNRLATNGTTCNTLEREDPKKWLLD